MLGPSWRPAVWSSCCPCRRSCIGPAPPEDPSEWNQSLSERVADFTRRPRILAFAFPGLGLGLESAPSLVSFLKGPVHDLWCEANGSVVLYVCSADHGQRWCSFPFISCWCLWLRLLTLTTQLLWGYWCYWCVHHHLHKWDFLTKMVLSGGSSYEKLSWNAHSFSCCCVIILYKKKSDFDIKPCFHMYFYAFMQLLVVLLFAGYFLDS